MKRWLAIFLLVFALRANAHEVRPAYLELTERAPGEFDVLWKVPAMGGAPLAGEEMPHPQPAVVDEPAATKTMPCGCPVPTAAQLSRGVAPIHPSLPKDAVIMALPRVERLFGAEIKRWTIQVPRGLEGWEVSVHGLPATMVDVLVRDRDEGRARRVALAAAGCAVVCFSRQGTRGRRRAGISSSAWSTSYLASIICSSSSRWCSSCAAWVCW